MGPVIIDCLTCGTVAGMAISPLKLAFDVTEANGYPRTPHIWQPDPGVCAATFLRCGGLSFEMISFTFTGAVTIPCQGREASIESVIRHPDQIPIEESFTDVWLIPNQAKWPGASRSNANATRHSTTLFRHSHDQVTLATKKQSGKA